MQAVKIRKIKHFTKSQKLEILKELKSSDMTIAAMARRYEIHPVTLHQWKRTMPKSQEPKKDEDLKEVLSENEKLKRDNENLKKALGEMAVDNQILKTYTEVLKKNQRKEKLKKRKK
jgi:transposase-like protein